MPRADPCIAGNSKIFSFVSANFANPQLFFLSKTMKSKVFVLLRGSIANGDNYAAFLVVHGLGTHTAKQSIPPVSRPPSVGAIFEKGLLLSYLTGS